ncbi:hypothetical protein L1987_87499 [Smallanthus sonchifolius]|nr:hypothetical protein L1987_87499 [Smallanthus sonchifolius]
MEKILISHLRFPLPRHLQSSPTDVSGPPPPQSCLSSTAAPCVVRFRVTDLSTRLLILRLQLMVVERIASIKPGRNGPLIEVQILRKWISVSVKRRCGMFSLMNIHEDISVTVWKETLASFDRSALDTDEHPVVVVITSKKVTTFAGMTWFYAACLTCRLDVDKSDDHGACGTHDIINVPLYIQGMLFMVEEAILGFAEKNAEIKDYGEFALEKGISQEGIVNVIKSLNGLRFVNGMEIPDRCCMMLDDINFV